jgi:GMP synthase-like glutamine amidotransferase
VTIAILETGEPPADLQARFGRYDAMFARLLGPGVPTRTYEVRAGDYPAAPDDHPAYLITGSPAGVYDGDPWIAELKCFLQAAKGRAKLVGICFGHQIMAEAFGGRVEKSERGWGVGLHNYDVRAHAPWMDPVARFTCPVSHQDQVVATPPAAEVLAGSAFNPNGLLAYRDQPAISFQCHPEFDPAFARALLETRRDRIAHADEALATLGRPDDRAMLATWIRRFLDERDQL